MSLSGVLAPHPVGFTNPEVMRAWAALPAANAWDADPTVVPCAGAWWMRFFITYERTGDSGSLDYYYQITPFATDALATNEVWFNGTLYAAGDLIPCQWAHSHAQREYVSYCAATANAETFISPPIHLAGCIERVRIFCRQTPGVGAPGNAEVIGYFYVAG